MQASLWDGTPESWRGPDLVEPDLRDYQSEAIRLIDKAWIEGKRAPLLVLPTGGGKTRVAAKLIHRIEQQRRQALFLAPRRELVYQASQALRHFGVQHGIIMSGADHLADKWSRCQVASIDTVLARTRNDRRAVPNTPNLVIIDEAHLSITKRRQELLDLWPNAHFVGLTATPSRKDGKALGVIYDELVEPATTASLTEAGYLCKARYFSLFEPNLKGVKVQAGDYNQKQLEVAMNTNQLVGDIVEHWLRLASDRRTVVFATSIAHSIALAERFQREGVKAAHVDANTPVVERTMTFNRFSEGRIQVLTNCFLAAYGFDLPELDCVVMARPTKSMVLYLQSLGRGLRIAEGKKDCLVLDHSGCVLRFGFPTDERLWTLEGKTALKAPEKRTKGQVEEAKRIKCPECGFVFNRSSTCPSCGYILKHRGQDEKTLPGKLVELNGEVVDGEENMWAREQFYLELRGFAVEKGYRPGWAAYKYKEKFGRFPPWDWNTGRFERPGVKTRRWIKSRQIAWAKSKNKGVATAR